jgi:hypothetical protein
MLVRVSPAFRGGRKTPHYGRAIIVSVGKSSAVVKPFGRHRKTESVPLTALRIWKSKQDFWSLE